MLYRLQQIKQNNQSGQSSDELTQILVNTNNGRQGIDFNDDPEFVEAIAWMYANDMTSRRTPNEFTPL